MKRSACLLITFLFLAVATCFSQSGDGAPISVKADPHISIAGKPVTFTGSTLVGKDVLPVTLKLETPEGGVIDLKTTTDKNGDFSISYPKAFTTGRYVVKAITADEKGTATDTFSIATVSGVVNEIQNTFFKSTQVIQKSLDNIIRSIDNLPASAELTAQKEKLSSYLPKLSELKASEEKLANDLKDLIKVSMDTHLSDSYLKDLDRDNKKIIDALPAIEEKAAELKNKSEVCEMINSMVEVCGFMSLVLDFKTTALKTLAKNLTSDKLIPGGLDRTVTGKDEEKEHKKMAINTAQKAAIAAADGAAGFANFIGTGLSLDLCSYIGKIIFARYCDELKGNFSAGFKGTFQADNGLAWWIYDLDLKGQLKLRYKKNTDLSEGVEISGEFAGYRTRYGVFEDFEQVEKIPPGMQLYKKFIRSPKAADLNYFNDDLGAGGMALIPGSFRMKVKGVVNNKNELRLTLADKTPDKSRIEVNTLWIILLNKLLPIPTVRRFEIPIASNKAIFTAILKDQVFHLEQVKDKIELSVKDNKTRLPLGGVVVETKLTMSLKAGE